jgi:hypothetical protein
MPIILYCKNTYAVTVGTSFIRSKPEGRFRVLNSLLPDKLLNITRKIEKLCRKIARISPFKKKNPLSMPNSRLVRF